MPPPRYITTFDRAGSSLAAGGGLAGLLVVAIVVASGQHAAWAIVGGWLLGSLFAILAIVAVAGPVWIALHATGRRGPLAAALTGAGSGLVVVTVAQGWSPPATAATLVLAAAGIGWTMQRIAYRAS